MEQELVKANVNGQEIIGVLIKDLHKTYINTLNDHQLIEIDPNNYNEYTGYNDSEDHLIFQNDTIKFTCPFGEAIGVVSEKGSNGDWMVDVKANFDLTTEFISLDGLCDTYNNEDGYKMIVQ